MVSDYIIPASVEEALFIKSKWGDLASFVAGGTDLFIQLREKKNDYKILVDLSGLSDLTSEIVLDKDYLSIPSCQTVNQLLKSDLVQEYAPILCEAAEQMAVPNIRNQATLGGNLVHASPAADLVPPLIALGATAHTVHPAGARNILVEDFLVGANQTIIYPVEILTKISVPIIQPREGTCFLKLGLREALTISVASAAIWLKRSNDDGRISQLRIALGSVAYKVIRAKEAEKILVGEKPDEETLEQAAKAASQCSKPISDLRASEDYRKAMVYELVKIAVRSCWEKTKN